jgi:hypothetical protein
MRIDTRHKFDSVLNWVDGEWVGSVVRLEERWLCTRHW